MTTSPISRGDIWWVDFDPAQGGEIRKTRPAVVLSNTKACAVQNRLQVVPVSSQADRIYPWEAKVVIQRRTCKALADQLRTVARTRLRSRIGSVTPLELQDIERAVRLQLDL